MSIEELIKENIAATKANTEALITLAAKIGVGLSTEAPKEDKAPKSRAAKSADTPAATTSATSSAPATQAQTAASATTAKGGVSYDEVKELILSTPREKVVPVLQKFGVAKAPDLKPEQYAAFIAALKGATTEEALV